MRYGEFLVDYIVWHYGRSIQDFLTVWSNYVWFLYNFFSIPLLLKTLFSPWRRMNEQSKVGFNMEAFFEKVMANFIVRIIGFGLRVFVIVSGCIAIFLTFIGGFAFFIIWVTLPLTLVLLPATALIITVA
jgi:hypothetical protein